MSSKSLPQRRLSRGVAIVAAIALGLLAVAVVAQLWSERYASLSSGERWAQGVTRSWEDGVITALNSVDVLLKAARAEMRTPPAEWRENRRRALTDSTLIRAVATVDRQGVVRQSTEDELIARRILPPGMLTQLRNSRSESLEIGPPTVGRFAITPESALSTQWHFMAAKPAFDSDDQFLGAAIAVVNPSVLAARASSFDVGPHGDVMLVRFDGLPLVRAATSRPPAAAIAEEARVTTSLSLIERTGFGVFQIKDPGMIVAYRSTSFFPVAAIVTIDVDSWLAPWRIRAQRFGLVTTALTAIAGLLFILLGMETRTAAQATEREHLLGAAIESTSSPVLITDGAGGLIWVNEAFTRLTGYTLDEVAGRNPRLLKSGSVPQERYDEMWRVISSGEGWRGDFVNRAKDGSLFEVEQTITPVQGDDDEIRYYVSIQTDVTREKAAERALVDAKREADDATRAKSQFLANMSHELRTPLNAVIGFSQMMRKEIFGPLGDRHYASYVADIESAAQHLLALISDLLDLSRIEVGKLELREEMKRPRDAFEACRHILSPKALKAGVTIDNALPPDAPMLWIDLLRLRQVLINLVYNSIKFTPRGGLVRVTGRQTGDGGYEISVVDNGAGIPPEELQRVLDPFVSRSLTSHQGEDHGTGLGLHLSRALMRAHGGDLQIESEEGTGTIVHLFFPASRVVDPNAHDHQL